MQAIQNKSNRQIINTIAQGDCIEVMRQMPANSVDFILTDPPYLVNYRDRSGRTIQNDANAEWLKPAMKEAYRVLKQNRVAVIFYGWTKVDTFFAAWKDAGFQPVGGKAAFKRGLGPPHVSFRVGQIDQLRGFESTEQGLILLKEILEPGATDLAFVEEGKTRDADAGDQDGKAIGEVKQPAHIALGQQFQFRAALCREEIDLGRFGNENVRVEVIEDEVEHHKPGFHVGIALDAAMLRSGNAESGIDGLRRQVINVPLLPATMTWFEQERMNFDPRRIQQ